MVLKLLTGQLMQNRAVEQVRQVYEHFEQTVTPVL
jgi:hypothetical protein